MHRRLEHRIIRRVFATLLLAGALLIAGAASASADGYGPDCSGCGSPAPHYGPTYPVPPAPEAPPGTPSSPPPVLPRTGSNTGTLVGIGAGALAMGGGLVLVARNRRRRLAVLPA